MIEHQDPPKVTMKNKNWRAQYLQTLEGKMYSLCSTQHKFSQPLTDLTRVTIIFTWQMLKSAIFVLAVVQFFCSSLLISYVFCPYTYMVTIFPLEPL